MIFYSDRQEIHEETSFPLFFLDRDGWNDRGYQTGFILSYYESFNDLMNLEATRIGLVKIGKVNMEHDSSKAYLKNPSYTKLPSESFDKLPLDYFSLGQDASYYSKIQQFFNKDEQINLLSSLNDVVYVDESLRIAKNEKVFSTSLIRNLSIHTIEGDFKSLVFNISAPPTSYSLMLNIEKEINDTPMLIEVIPRALPPTNLHAIIGRNGVGKSFFFKALINKMSKIDLDDKNEFSIREKQYIIEFFTELKGIENISSILAIDLSAFDSTMPKKTVVAVPKENKIRYTFIGFPFSETENRENIGESTKIDEMLLEEFKRLSKQIIERESQVQLLLDTLRILESDPMFENNSIREWFVPHDYQNEKESDFNRLSSGHKICLLMILELVLNVEVNSLILIDEPELHLHPPLLSSLIKAINNILELKNAVGLIATHSPVVLQEITSDCVWIINREGRMIRIERPKIETFGENISTLTREVFGLEVRDSGYERLIREIVEESESLTSVFEKFNNNLSENARLLAAVLWEEKHGF